MLDERRTCSRCGNFDCFETEPKEELIGWPDGRRYVVRIFRCLACGALDLVQRVNDKRNSGEDITPEDKTVTPGDGLRMTVTPTESG